MNGVSTRDYSGGKWLTSKSEVEKKQKAEEEKVLLQKEKIEKRDQKALERVKKQQEKEQIKVEQKKRREEKKHEAEIAKEAKIQSGMHEKGKCQCYMCRKIVKKPQSVQCIICKNYMHIHCAQMINFEPVVCPKCLAK